MDILSEVTNRLLRLKEKEAIKNVIENLGPVRAILDKNEEVKRTKSVVIEEVEVLIEELGQSLKDVYKLTKDNPNPPTLPLEVKGFMRYLLKILKDTGVPAACKAPVGDLNVTFDNIQGQDVAKNTLLNIYTNPIKYPGLYPKRKGGILFYGPPGTGKTLLAKAVAKSLPGVVLFAASAAVIKGRYVGDTERNTKRLFECVTEYLVANASKYNRAIIFIDEIDAIAGKRGGDDPHMTSSVDQLLQQIDGLDSNPNIDILAATNHPEKLDPAILSRFGNSIFVDLPTYESRIAMIERKLQSFYHNPANRDQSNLSFIAMFSAYGTYGQQFFRKADIEQAARLLGPRGPPMPVVGDSSNIKERNRLMWLHIRLRSAPQDRDSITELEWLNQPAEFWKKYRNTAREFFPTANSLFGYSGRDIDMLLDKAIVAAAMRATAPGALFKKHSVPGTDLPNASELMEIDDASKLRAHLVRYGVSFDAKTSVPQLRSLVLSIPIPTKTLWLYDYNKSIEYERAGGNATIPSDFEVLPSLEKKVPKSDLVTIRNYCFTPKDVQTALSQSPSTIQENDYYRAIDYAIGNGL